MHEKDASKVIGTDLCEGTYLRKWCFAVSQTGSVASSLFAFWKPFCVKSEVMFGSDSVSNEWVRNREQLICSYKQCWFLFLVGSTPSHNWIEWEGLHIASGCQGRQSTLLPITLKHRNMFSAMTKQVCLLFACTLYRNRLHEPKLRGNNYFVNYLNWC